MPSRGFLSKLIDFSVFNKIYSSCSKIIVLTFCWTILWSSSFNYLSLTTFIKIHMKKAKSVKYVFMGLEKKPFELGFFLTGLNLNRIKF